MSKILNEKDIRDVIRGATLLGGGGGGSMQGGITLLEKYKKNHPDEEIIINLIDVDEMKEDSYAAVTAGMGSPLALKDLDFTSFAVNSYEALVDMAANMNPPKKLEYTCSVEIGGFNTFVPMLISLIKGIPFVNADGAGRAVPALDTLLLHVNGCNTSPLAMADANNDRVYIELSDPRDAHRAEVIGRNICVAFGMMGGLSGWMLTKKEIKENIANDTIEYSREIGAAIEECCESSIFEYLLAKGFKARSITSGKITKVKAVIESGFDYGEFVVTNETGEDYVIKYQNENLLVSKGDHVIMTAPDIIGVYDMVNKRPLTNADIEEGMNVEIGAIKADERWWKMGKDHVNNIWKLYFKNVNYYGDIVQF